MHNIKNILNKSRRKDRRKKVNTINRKTGLARVGRGRVLLKANCWPPDSFQDSPPCDSKILTASMQRPRDCIANVRIPRVDFGTKFKQSSNKAR